MISKYFVGSSRAHRCHRHCHWCCWRCCQRLRGRCILAGSGRDSFLALLNRVGQRQATVAATAGGADGCRDRRSCSEAVG